MPWSDYQKVREIGSGSFGRAILVKLREGNDKNPAGTQLVLKEIDLSGRDAGQRAAAEVEVKVLSHMKHPYIVRYWESFTHSQHLCIVMDYCDGGDLWHYISSWRQKRGPSSHIPEPHVLRWFTQISLALKYMHDKNVLHRDIKTQNIFLARKEGSDVRSARIADFGISKVLKDDHSFAKTFVGTPYYLSPEMCQKQPYACPSDVWAVGCVLFELCALRVPFEAQDMSQLINCIVRGPLPRVPSAYSRDIADLVAEMLNRDAGRRATAKAILEKPLVQSEIARLFAENKTDKAERGERPGGGERQQQGGGGRGREPSVPRDRDGDGGGAHREPSVPRDGRGRAPGADMHCRREPSRDRGPSKPGSRAQSPIKQSPIKSSPHKVAMEVLKPSRAPSPSPNAAPVSSRRRGGC